MVWEKQLPHMPRVKYTVKAHKAIYKVHKKQKKAMETRIYNFNIVTHWFLLELSQ